MVQYMYKPSTGTFPTYKAVSKAMRNPSPPLFIYWPDRGLGHGRVLIGCSLVIPHPQGHNLLPKVQAGHVKTMEASCDQVMKRLIFITSSSWKTE